MEKIIGITAEYNPFHKGHLHQFNEIKRLNQNAEIIVALSSNFLQRGTPALLDKWERARAAVLCGADLALELPFPFCCNNAGVFAMGAIATFKATGLVNAVSFGMEDETELLNTIPSILVHEPQSFKFFLTDFLKKGFSFAESRARAVDKLCPGGGDLLKKPNNTLAFAYAEAVKRQNANFELLPVVRRGAGYHDTSGGEMMSAAGIRATLAVGREAEAFNSMPEGSARILSDALRAGRVCSNTTKLWNYLRLLLTRLRPEELARFAGIGEGMENRVLEKFSSCGSFEELVESVATRRYPRTRIQRQLCAVFMNFSNDDDQLFQHGGPAYIRPLAMNERGCKLLAKMRKTASLPIVTKPSALRNNGYAEKIFALEMRSAELWECLIPKTCPGRELRSVPAILP